MHFLKSGLIFMALPLLLASCNTESVALTHPALPSYAIPQDESTTLGKALKAEMRKYPGQSGFRLLTTGSESFTMRLALIRAAEKTLDLQYYSIHDDTTSNLLLEALIQAARRGVRIRFLLDNISFSEVDKTFAVLDGLKGLEVRVFNPTVTREHGLLDRAVLAVTDLDSMNRRMHNKALIGDNQMAITGGRNLGDEYFEENPDMTFRDLDILAAGPIAAQISRSFDQFWNSKDAVPLGQLREPETKPERVEEIREALSEHWEKVRSTDRGRKVLDYALTERLKDAEVKLTWARAELAADTPQKVNGEQNYPTSPPMMRLDRMLERANKEFIAVTAYFVPREEGVKWLNSMVERGMEVKILTNSLASTDVVAVHAGYGPYREALLKGGVELYEMKPAGGKRPRQRLIGKSAPARASLHSKVYVVDRKEVMIGSFNLDPRSIELNTEIALIIHSPELAAQIVKMFQETTAPDTSYRLELRPEGGIVWVGKNEEGPEYYNHDPQAGIIRNIQTVLLGLLPLEDHL